MGLFHKHENQAPPPPRETVDHSHKRGGLFHRRSPTPPPPARHIGRHSGNGGSRMAGGLFNPRTSASSSERDDPTRHTSNRHSRGGLFHRRSSSVSSSDCETSRRSPNRLSRSGGGGFLGRGAHEDPSITAARERLTSAERAEEEAGRAVMQARDAVHEAREHMKILEHEANEESRLAKIKQTTARDLGKRSKPLGRYS